MILFGSYARGEINHAADIDLAVVFPDQLIINLAQEIIDRAYRNLRINHFLTGEVPGGITLEAVAEGQIIGGDGVHNLYGNIKREGIYLYNKSL